MQEYTEQLAHLKEQHRRRHAMKYEQQASSAPQSPAIARDPVEPRHAHQSTNSDDAQRGSASARPADDDDPIQQYQRMLLLEQQRRIREMNEQPQRTSRSHEQE